MSASDRAKHQVALHGRSLAVVFLLVGLLALGGGVYVFLNPPVQEISPQEADVQEFSTTVEHSAIVVNDTALYSEEQVLNDQPRYFYAVTPVLNLSTVAQVPADRSVNVSHELTLSYRATAGESTFYVRNRTLVDREASVSDGSYVVNTSLDVVAVRNEATEIQNEIGTLGTVSTLLTLETTYRTSSTQDGTYEGTLNGATTFEFADQGYWLTNDIGDSTTERTMVGGGVEQQGPNIPLVAGLGILGVLAVVLALLVAYWSSRKVDLQELETKIDRRQYAEWISNGNFPTDSGKQYVYIDSLEDLVDVAIDTNKRVIFDAEIETYAVADDDIIYYHAPDPRSVSAWLDLS